MLKKPKPVYTAPVYNSDVIDWDEYTIVGTSLQLEKNYLRLTSVSVCWMPSFAFKGDVTHVFYFAALMAHTNHTFSSIAII